MIAEKKKYEVYLWDNDPLKQHYNVGVYDAEGYIMPYELYEDVLMKSRDHDVFFSFEDIVDAFLRAALTGDGQAVAVDCSMFLQVEVINGN